MRLPVAEQQSDGGKGVETETSARPAAVGEPVLDSVLGHGRDHELADADQGEEDQRDDQESAHHRPERFAAPGRRDRLATAHEREWPTASPRVLAIDAGGTMTDTFIVDERGAFVVGKAQTTPEDESVGFMASAADALDQWGSTPAEALPQRWPPGIYSGTAMLNRLLSRAGAARSARSSPPGRRTTCGSSAASRPTSATPTRTASTSRPTTTTSRSSRASG